METLRWDDLDFENRVISVNHSVVYYPVKGTKIPSERELAQEIGISRNSTREAIIIDIFI